MREIGFDVGSKGLLKQAQQGEATELVSRKTKKANLR